jgi:hypothetical protein
LEVEGFHLSCLQLRCSFQLPVFQKSIVAASS